MDCSRDYIGGHNRGHKAGKEAVDKVGDNMAEVEEVDNKDYIEVADKVEDNMEVDMDSMAEVHKEALDKVRCLEDTVHLKAL